MGTASITTAGFLFGDRHVPPAAYRQQVDTLERSGVVDHMAISAQLGNFVPPQLWTTENTPMAHALPDADSLWDGFIAAGYAHALAPSLGVSVLLDSHRLNPAHLTQTMWTMAHLTEGRTNFFIGAGEMKNCQPFGFRRGEGLKRLEDALRMSREFWDSDGPVSVDGRVSKLDRAFLGGARTYRPKVFAMGGGPKLIDLATSYADGLASAAPCNWRNADEAAASIAVIRRDLERKGRDPESFEIGMFCPVLIHENPQVILDALDNPIIRWVAATFGHIRGESWALDGLASPMPPGWEYHAHFLPHATEASFIADAVAATTRQHTRVGYLAGSPAEVAAQVQAFLDAGVSYVGLADYLPLVSPPADHDSLVTDTNRSVTCFRHLTRNRNLTAAPTSVEE
jgi:phthiodiolone/phenolphthiodiolone dimycocerosates ketoreductase